MTEQMSFDPIAAARSHWEARWPDAAPGMEVITSVMRAHQLLLARVDAGLRPHGLTFARFELLMLLSFSRRGALPMRVVGTRLQVHPTSVTNAVDRLEQDELVARRPHPRDRRAVVVELLDPGRELASLAAADLNARVFCDLGLDPSDQQDVVRALRELRRAHGDF